MRVRERRNDKMTKRQFYCRSKIFPRRSNYFSRCSKKNASILAQNVYISYLCTQKSDMD